MGSFTPTIVRPPTPPAPGTVVPPFGLPTTGGFVNPAGFVLSTSRLLPNALSQAKLALAEPAHVVASAFFNANAGAIALAQNQQAVATAPSAGTNNTAPAVGSEGSTGLEGATGLSPGVVAGNYAPVSTVGNAPVVGPLAQWQYANPTLDLVGRLGLPVAAFLAYRRGSTIAAVGAGAIAALLWYNRGRGAL